MGGEPFSRFAWYQVPQPHYGEKESLILSKCRLGWLYLIDRMILSESYV